MYGMGVAVGDYRQRRLSRPFRHRRRRQRLFHNVKGKDGRRRFVDVTDDGRRRRARRLARTASSEAVRRVGQADRLLARRRRSSTTTATAGSICSSATTSPGRRPRTCSIDASLTGIGRSYLPPTQFEGTQCFLYRNIDGKHFEDVSAEAGVQVVEREGTDETLASVTSASRWASWCATGRRRLARHRRRQRHGAELLLPQRTRTPRRHAHFEEKGLDGQRRLRRKADARGDGHRLGRVSARPATRC